MRTASPGGRAADGVVTGREATICPHSWKARSRVTYQYEKLHSYAMLYAEAAYWLALENDLIDTQEGD